MSENEVQIPEDLQNLLGELQKLEFLHEVLKLGMFPGNLATGIADLQVYVKNVHQHLWNTIQNHESFDMIKPSAEIKVNEEV